MCVDIPAPVKLAAHSLYALSHSWAYVLLRLLIGYQIHLHFSNRSGLMLGGRETLPTVWYDGGRKRSRCLKHLITGVLPVGLKQLNANFCVQRCHRHWVISRDSPLSHPLIFHISLFSNYQFFFAILIYINIKSILLQKVLYPDTFWQHFMNLKLNKCRLYPSIFLMDAVTYRPDKYYWGICSSLTSDSSSRPGKKGKNKKKWARHLKA